MEVSDTIQLIIALVMTGTLVAASIQINLLSRQIKSQEKANRTQAELINEQIKLLIQQQKAQYEQQKAQYDWAKKEKALEYSLSKNPGLQQIRKDLDKAFGGIYNLTEPISMEEIRDKLNTDTSRYTDISALLAHWENLALAISCGVVDKNVAFEMTAGILIKYVNSFKNFIDDRRGTQNKRAYYYLRNLVQQWENDLNVHPTKNVKFQIPEL